MKLQIALLSLVLITLCSCGFDASKYYTPTAVNASKASVSVEELIAGRTAYMNACKNCHRLFKPNKNSASEWTRDLDKMQERAKISDKEKQQIYKYLTSEIPE